MLVLYVCVCVCVFILNVYEWETEISRNSPSSSLFSPICRVYSKRRLQIEKCPWCCDSVVVIRWLAWDGYPKMISLVFISNFFIQQCNEKNPNVYISKEKNLWKFLNSIIMLCPHCHQISPDIKIVFLWKMWECVWGGEDEQRLTHWK